MSRALYVALGSLSAGTGFVAIFIPGLPTTVFLLIALWCFTRSSPRMEAWLRGHRLLGPYLAAWEADRAIPRHVKVVAALAMLSTVLVAWLVVSVATPLVVGLALVLAVVLAWIVRRPEPTQVPAAVEDDGALV